MQQAAITQSAKSSTGLAAMKAALNQRMIERAVRGSTKAGLPPMRVECHPDGRIVLWFGESKVSAEDGLDQELTYWKRGHDND
ncbi:MAG TPA: hypothetical protein VGM26_02130 [Rhizomicrobium sp.]